MKKIGGLVVLFLLIASNTGWCTGDWVSEQAASDVYYVKAGGMFLRGLQKIVTAPAELGYHTYTESKNNFQYGAGILKGLGTGALWTADGVLRGAWDIVTALFPDYHGEPGTHDISAELRGETTEATTTS